MIGPNEVAQQYSNNTSNQNTNANNPQQHDIEQPQPEGLNYNKNSNENNHLIIERQVPAHPQYGNNDDIPPAIELKYQQHKREGGIG